MVEFTIWWSLQFPHQQIEELFSKMQLSLYLKYRKLFEDHKESISEQQIRTVHAFKMSKRIYFLFLLINFEYAHEHD